VLARALGLPSPVAMGAGAALCFGLRYVAIRHGWQLPVAGAATRDSASR
jgi:uncharacterized membrane protein YeiH